MSKRIFGIFAVLALTGCAGRGPVHGGIYQDTTYSIAATSNQAGNRVGEACASQIIGWIATGDQSIEAARRNGGITMVSAVDESTSNILGIYAKSCTIVRGR